MRLHSTAITTFGVVGTSRAFAVDQGDEVPEGPECLQDVGMYADEVWDRQGVNGDLKVRRRRAGDVGISGCTVGVEEGCLVEGDIAVGAGAVRGVGSRFLRRGELGLCVNINLNMSGASHGE
jgi:hypothetical protein